MEGLQIRKITPSDIDNIYQAICKLEKIEYPRKKFEKSFFPNLMDENVYYLVAEKEGSFAGFISLHLQTLIHHCGKVAEVQELFVEDSYRGQGIGADLLHEVEKIAQENECELIEVASNSARSRAAEFYVSEGYSKSHVKFTKILKDPQE
jgi:(aminoalkyl)phosphonate N-acetyltransferase